MAAEKIVLKDSANIRFNNNVDFCVGTGRTGLALCKEYLDELSFVQEEIGFKHIRGHGLFSDDVAIYREYEENGKTKVEYNFTYLDRIYDSYLERNIRPFIELGFMPGKLASGTQTIFYWKGNTTPPKDYKLWQNLLKAYFEHIIDRYGFDEVKTWPIEVWNEPNLPGFWKDADMDEYFKLFTKSFEAIKKISPEFKVGGPAICGVRDEEWIKAFCEYLHKNKIVPDFFTRHHYTVEFPERVGHYDYHVVSDPEYGFKNLKSTRDIIDSYKEFKGLPIHITEFSTSYTPYGVIHDTNYNAAYLARLLSRMGDVNESYSYWTFGDVFEEQGVPYTPFHGGFGLVAAGCIPKPTFYTFSFFKKLKDKAEKCILRQDDAVVVKTKDGYAGVVWNISKKKITKEFDFKKGEYSLLTQIVDEDTCNPLKLWHNLGEHANPTKAEVKMLRDAAKPLTSSERVTESITVDVKKNGVVYFELVRSTINPDRGYDYKRVLALR